MILLIKKFEAGAGEMAQALKTPAALAENPGSVHNIHMTANNQT